MTVLYHMAGVVGHKPVNKAVRGELNGHIGEGAIEKVGVTGDFCFKRLLLKVSRTRIL